MTESDIFMFLYLFCTFKGSQIRNLSSWSRHLSFSACVEAAKRHPVLQYRADSIKISCRLGFWIHAYIVK